MVAQQWVFTSSAATVSRELRVYVKMLCCQVGPAGVSGAFATVREIIKQVTSVARFKKIKFLTGEFKKSMQEIYGKFFG